MVIALMGLSGSGKSTVGRLLTERLRARWPSTLFLDGDELREAVSYDLGHSEADRRQSEMRRIRLCRLLAGQGFHVVCAAVSNCPDLRDWCRVHIPGFMSVYLKADDRILELRDPKQLYARFGRKEIKQVVGRDIPFNEPLDADMTVDMNESDTAEVIADRIAAECVSRIKRDAGETA